MASWLLTGLHVVVFAAWGVSGLVAVLLAPRNRAARRLAAAGTLLVLTRLLDHLLVTEPTSSAAWRDAWQPRLLSEVVFLAALAALVAALTVFPDGRYDRRADRVLVGVLLGATAVFAACRFLGSAVIRTPTDGDAGAANPHASSALAGLDRVADAVFATEPAWILLGVLALVLRYARGDAQRRAALRWPLRALLVLAGALVLVIVGNTTGLLGEGPVPTTVFLAALALFPVSLLAAVVGRVRALEARLAASRARLVVAEDAVRRQVERDLHDGVQQQLTAIRSLVTLAQRQAGRDPRLAARTLGEIADETDDAMRDLRQLVAGIHPAVLSDHGLAAAIAARLRRLPLESSFAPAPDVDGVRWDPAIEGAAYFTVCEALTNAVKHARATRVEVGLAHDEGNLRVQVRDDGCGFDDAAVRERGLVGVRDRIESLGGSFTVVARPGAGTTVELCLPAVAR
jgi:signal transduction histidine kinase